MGFANEDRRFDAPDLTPLKAREPQCDFGRLHQFDDDDSGRTKPEYDEFDPRVALDSGGEHAFEERYRDFVEFYRAVRDRAGSLPALAKEVWSRAVDRQQSEEFERLTRLAKITRSEIYRRSRLLATVSAVSTSFAKSATEAALRIADFVVEYAPTLLLQNGALEAHRENAIGAATRCYGSFISDPEPLLNGVCVETARLYEIVCNTKPRSVPVVLDRSVLDDLVALRDIVKFRRRIFVEILLKSKEPGHRVTLADVERRLNWRNGRDAAWSGLQRDMNRIAEKHDLQVRFKRHDNNVLAVHASSLPPKITSGKMRKRSKNAGKKQ